MTQQEIQLIDDKLSTEVIHRSEGDLLSQAMISKYAADMLIENEKEYQRYVEHLSKTSDITEGLRNLIDNVQVRLLTTCVRIEEELDKSNKTFADDITDLKKGLDKYLRILSDATLDSDRITWDNGEIQLGAWTFLSQARQWDLEILKKIESNYKKLDEELKEKLEEELNNFDTTEEVISKVIEELSNVPVIKELDELLNSGIKDIELLKEDLHTEVLERSKAIAEESLRMANALADEARLRAEGLAKEAQDRVDEIVQEKNTRIEQIEAEVANRIESVEAIKDALDVEIANRIESVDAINDAIDAETEGRLAAIKLLEDGLTKEIQFRTEGDEANLSALENYKTSNDNSLSNIREEIGVNVSAITANAEKITALDSRLTINEGEATTAKELAATAVQKANTALTENEAQAELLNSVSASITALDSELKTKVDASAFNVIKAEVTEINGKLTSATTKITALENNFISLDGSVKTNAQAISNLESKQTIQEGKITQLTSDTTLLKNSLTTVENNLATKVDTTAFNSLKTEVTKQGKDITSLTTEQTLLKNSLDTVSGTLLTKADSTALEALESVVTVVDGKVSSQGTSITNLKSGLATTDTNVTAAQNAANAANTLAGGKGKVLYQSTVPAAADRLPQNLWIDTTSGANTPKRWNGSAWASVTDKVATDAATAAANALKVANTKADATALNALDTKVTTIEGNVTSQGTSITKLTNDLATTNTNVAKKANTTALNALDTKVTSVDGKVTTNASAITTLQGRATTIEGNVAKKADASALNNYYTKAEADTATAGKIDEFKSSLTAGGTNLIPASNMFRVGAAASTELVRTILSDGSLRLTNKGALDTSYLASFQSADTNFNEVYNIATGSDITVTFWFKAVDISKLPTSYITSYLNGASGGYIKLNGDLSALVSGKEVPFSNTRKWRGGTINPYITATASSLGGGLILTKWQIEKGNIPSDWSDHSSAVQSQIDANASAIQTTNSEVARVDGRVTTESNRITSLNGKISTVEEAVSTKADASALSNMYTKAETDTKAQQIAAGELNKFTASLSAEGVNLYGYDMSTLAASSGTWAGSGYSISRVLGGGLTSQETAYKIKAGGSSGNYFTSGRGDWKSAVEPVIGNKYILSMYVKSPIAKTVRLLPMGITEYNGTSTLIPAENFDLVPDTWTRISVVYTTSKTNYPYIGWWLYHNYDGGAASDDNYVLVTRPMLERTYNEKAIPSVWTEGSGSSSAINANSVAIQNTDAEVKRVDGKINATNSAITTLEGRIAVNEKNIVLKADASALDALTTRVTTEEGKTASQGTRVTALENKVNHSTNGLDSKASSKALTTLDSKVTLIDGRVTSNTSAITTLNSSVTNVENKLSTKLDADVIASYYTKAETDSVVAGKVDEFKASLKGGGVNLFGYAMSTTQPSRGTWIGYAYNVTRVEGGGISESEHAYKVFPSSTISTSAYFISGAGDWHTKVEKDTDYILSIYVKSPMAKTVRLRQLMLNDADARSWTANEESYSIPADTWTRISLRITEKKENYPYLPYALYFNTEGLSATEDNYVLVTRPMLETTIGSGKEPSAWVEGSGAGAFIDANATAIQNTNTEVGRIDGVVSGHTIQLSNLTASVAGKADTSALNALTARVEVEEGKSTSQASSITDLSSSVTDALKAVTIADTRSTNQPPSWYLTNYPRRVVNEFKTQTAIGVGGFFGGTYCNLETKVYYSDLTGGDIIQTATSSADPSLYVQRKSNGTTAWTAWKQPIKDLRDTLGTKASASAVTSLTTKVNTIDGKVSSHASTLTQLQSKVDGNAAKLVIQGEVVDGLKASYVIKTDVNGLVSGFGLYNDGSSSTFGVNADSFYVGKGTQKKKAFLVTTTNQVVDGVTYPAGTYIDVAMIANATIGNAHIADASITNAKIKELDASKITTGTLDAKRIRIGSTTQFDDGYKPSDVLNTAKTYVDNIQIGGTNLYTNTREFAGTGWSVGATAIDTTQTYRGLVVRKTTGQWSGIKQTIAAGLYPVGTELTLSFYAKGDTNGKSFGVYGNNVGNYKLNGISTQNGTLTTSWTRQYVTFTISGTGAANIRPENNSTTGTVFLCGLKLEVGNKASEWTPAPEDVDVAIESKSKTFTTQPTTPYKAGDIWRDGSSIKVCTVTRASGSYTVADWTLVGDVTSANTAANSNQLGGKASSTVFNDITGAKNAADAAASKANAADTQLTLWKYPNTTEIDGGKIYANSITANQISTAAIDAIALKAQNATFTAADGSKTVIKGGLTEVFYPNGNIAVRLGVW